MFGHIQVRTSLRILRGPRITVGPVRTFETARIRIGRHGDNDLVFESPGVSRYHAEIIVNTEGCWIRDLGSATGTKVNGKQIVGQHRLPEHARIEVSEFEMEMVPEPGDSAQTGQRAQLLEI